MFVVLWHLLYLTSCHNKNADLPDKKAMSETITSGFNASDSLLTALIGNYQNLGQMLDSIEILQQQFDTIGQSKLMNRIANICRNTGNYQEALVYYNRSQQLLKTKLDQRLLAEILHGKAATYFEVFFHNFRIQRFLDSTNSYAQYAYKLSVDAKDTVMLANALNIQAAVAIELGQYSEAEVMLKQALAYSKRYSDIDPLAIMSNMAYATYMLGQVQESQRQTQDYIKLAAERNNIVFVGLGIQNLMRIYQATGDSVRFKQAQARFLALQNNQDVMLQSIWVKELFLEEENKVSQTKLADAHTRQYFLLTMMQVLLAALILLLMLLSVIYFRMRQHRRLRLVDQKLSREKALSDELTIRNNELAIQAHEAEGRMLEEELKASESTLNAKMLALSGVNELLNELQALVYESIQSAPKKKTLLLLEKAARKLDQRNSNDWWSEYEMMYGTAHKGFMHRLELAHPGLSINEKRLAYFSLSSLTTKEMASVMRKSYRSVEMARHRLRARLGLNTAESLHDYLSRFAGDTAADAGNPDIN